MNALLTSTGISTPESRLFFSKKFPEFKGKRVALIYSIRQPEDLNWLPHYERELEELGLGFAGVNISEENNLSVLKGFDGYYVCGGNTFYILDRLKKTGLFTFLLEEVTRGKLYIGASAGSIIFGPDVEIAGWGKDGDQNDIGLDDLSAMNCIPSNISPHYADSNEGEVLEFEEVRKQKVIRLRDGEIAVVKSNASVTICCMK